MSKKSSIRVGTRASPLAVAQTKLVCQELQRHHPELEFDLIRITTSGDRIQDRFLDQVGGKGLFVKEIEEALQLGEIDFAVHSMKDLPSHIPDALDIACIPKRLNYHDILVSRQVGGLATLPQGAKLGTSSLRRRVQLARLRPDLQFLLLRGNIDSRIKKLEAREFDGIVLAQAGLMRLKVAVPHAAVLPILPAPGQGALALEIRREDQDTRKILQPLHDANTERCINAERRVMRAFGGDCNLPLGVLAQMHDGQFEMAAFLGLSDGSRKAEDKIQGSVEDALKLADGLIEKLRSQGAEEIVRRCRAGEKFP